MWSRCYLLLLPVLAAGIPDATHGHPGQARTRPTLVAMPREVLVRIRTAGVDPSAIDTTMTALTARFRAAIDTCSRTPDEMVLRYRLPDDQTLQEAITTVERLGHRAQPNYLIHQLSTPDDPGFGRQWSLHNTGSQQDVTGAVPDADINAPEAWVHETGDTRIAIGVVDSGVDGTHPDLVDNMWHNEFDPVNGADDDGNDFVDDHYGLDAMAAVASPGAGAAPAGKPVDLHGHGTKVAGIVGARGNNYKLLAGVLWNTRIVACRFLPLNNNGCTCDAIKCLDYLTTLKHANRNDPDHKRGANIVATTASWETAGEDHALAAAIARQRDAGIVLVAAAGDSSTDNDCKATYPASFTLSNVIAVAESDSADALAPLSNCGAHSVHLAAPGMNVPALETGLFRDVSGKFGGTSAAVPHVAAMVGLLASRDGRDGIIDWPWWALRNLVIAGGQIVPGASRTVSRRRLRAFDAAVTPEAPVTGSMSCAEQFVRRRLEPIARYAQTDGSRVARQEHHMPVPLTAISIACANADGPVVVAVYRDGVADAERVALTDDGIAPDQTANDGIYAGTWTPPPGTGTAVLKFLYGATQTEQTSDTVTVQVVDTITPPPACACSP